MYRATITFTFAPDNLIRAVEVAMVLSTGTTQQSLKVRPAAGSAARQLVSVIRRPGAGYQTAAGWPVPVEAAVVDDCGDPLEKGRVVASFSSNDLQLTLLHTGSGIWQSTWASRTQAASNLTITIAAQSVDQTLAGQTQVAIRSDQNPDQPSISPGGVLNAASFRAETPLAPGAYVSVFGARLARQFEAASTLPLPASLGETVVAIAGRVAPLHFASDGQVNAILPYNIADNTTHQMIVRRGNLPSLPESLVIGSVQPAVFTADGTGKGQGHIYGTTPEGRLVLADNARPVKAGDIVVIYATGLGPVNVDVAAGSAAPSGPFALVSSRMTVTIQGKRAKILFAGLARGFAGVYQINAQIPADVTPDAGADAVGNIYVADGTARVRKITANGFVSTVAGNGTRGYSGDGGLATDAALNGPMGISLDANGNLYIADTENNRIRRVQGSAPFVATPFSLVFSYALGSPAAPQALRLSSSDGESRVFQVLSTAPWLAASPSSGQVSTPATLNVTASPAGLGKGTYGAQLRIESGSGAATLVPVTMTISGTAAQLRLSQVGRTFNAIQGGAAPPPQTLQVLNTGTGSMAWSAAAAAFAGNATWLTVAPAAGTTTAGTAAPSLTINVNPAGLAAGSYYGQINVTSGAADNSPQSAIVLLNVLPADGASGPQVDPSGLLFTAAPGANPATQNIEIANLSTRGISYTASVRLTNGTGWLTAPAAGNLTAGQRQRIDIQPRGLSLAAGVYRATITFTFAPDNLTRTVDIALVLNTGITTPQSSKAPVAAGCAAKQLVSVIRRPGAGYQTPPAGPFPSKPRSWTIAAMLSKRVV